MIEDKPILKAIRAKNREYVFLIVGTNENKSLESGTLNDLRDYISRNSNDDTAYLFEIDEYQWVTIGKENWII